MNAYRLGALALAMATLAPACAFAASDSLTVPMKALNDSGETGTAVLTQQDDGVRVVVTLKNAPKDTQQPTHIHIGTCGNIKAAPEYAVNVHKSGDDLGTYVACGDIK